MDIDWDALDGKSPGEIRAALEAHCEVRGHDWHAVIVHEYKKPNDRDAKIVSIHCRVCGKHWGGATITHDYPGPEPV